MNLSEPSKLWPILKRSANLVSHIKIPGMDLTFDKVITILAGIQDDLTQNKWEDDVKQALNAVRDHTQMIARELANLSVTLSPQELSEGMLDLTERHYRLTTTNEYLYADFKGIEQDVNFIPLELDEVFVNLHVRPEHLDGRDYQVGQALQELEEFDTTAAYQLQRSSDRDALRSIDQVLAEIGGVVLLGGPGSGKTTLVKRLARSCALGAEAMRTRYPAMPNNLFPVVVSMTLFDAWRIDGRSIWEYIQHRLHDQGGPALWDVFERCWRQDRCLILLDGLDEVASADHRIGSARAVDTLYKNLHGNRALTTSRIVGYNVCRLATPARHVVLQPLGRDDIERFVRQWHNVREKATHIPSPDRQRAAEDAQALLNEIHASPHVASLASNPLMLTIIALIKQRNVTLPERRVELYETAINTLLRSWNKARSLSGLPLGTEPRLEQTKRVWAAIAHWMHAETSHGSLHRSRLHQKLVDVLVQRELTEHQAEAEAESYLQTAAESTGLLEAQGPNTFAFVHQTFQEYLAANHLTIPPRRVVVQILKVAGDPRWHEVIRLAAGIIGIYQLDEEILTQLTDELLADNQDPLEPFLCIRLRLIAACMTDNVGFRQRDINRVIERLAERLMNLPAQWPIITPLVQALESLPIVQPERLADTTVMALCRLAKHDNLQPRKALARKLSEIAERSDMAQQTLKQLSTDEDGYVKVHATLGLWYANRALHPLTLKAIHKDADVRCQALQVLEDWGYCADIVPTLNMLLKDDDTSVQLQAAKVLAGWGYHVNAVSTLKMILKDKKAFDRLQAAEVLVEWGYHVSAVPTLLALLKDRHPFVRLQAAEVLGKWGPYNDAIPTLKMLLKDEDAFVQLKAAQVLGAWGPRTDVVPTLLTLLKDENAFVRLQAAEILGAWDYRADVVPTLLTLLKDENPSVRLLARPQTAMVLGKLGPRADIVPTLLTLLEDENAFVRFRTTEALMNWDPRADIVPTLLTLLEDENAFVRLQAAEILGVWDYRGDVVPTLLTQLKDEDVFGFKAAQILGDWGPRADVVPTLLTLLEHKNVSIRLKAAQVLGDWGSDYDVVESLLTHFVVDGHDHAMTFLLSNGDAQYNPCPPEAAAALVTILKPTADDTPGDEARREVVFRWLWHISQSS